MSDFSASERLPVPYVVHGSFRKHLDVIQDTIALLDSTGCAEAIAPHNCTASGDQGGFVLLAGEQNKDPRQIEVEYLQKVLSLKALGGFSLWVAPGGYVGKSAAYEYGVAQACGIPAFFTEAPADVPFYVSPNNVRGAAQLADTLLHGGSIADAAETDNAVGELWRRLPFPTAVVAVGGIVRYDNRILLVDDGRWPDGKLTVPGTTVRSRETRDGALARALDSKFGMSAQDVIPLQTSFMAAGSGYAKPVNSMVFDDRIITLSSDRANPQPGIGTFWVGQDEAAALLQTEYVEPNASALITEYFAGCRQ